MISESRTKRPVGIVSSALTVAAKEIREGLRDRQTVLYTVVIPLALYPVMFWVMLQVFLIVKAQDTRTAVVIGVVGTPRGVPESRVDAVLARTTGDDDSDRENDSPRKALSVKRLAPALTRDQAAALLIDPDSGQGPKETLDAIVMFHDPRPEQASAGAADAQSGADVLLVSTRSNARLAAERAQARLEELGVQLRTEALQAAGRDPDSIAPFTLHAVDLSKQVDRGGMILSFILPMMFVVMSTLGAFFPAVDITAGEKERHTIETTLLLPVPRSAVQLGKVLTVTMAAAVATIVNMVGMGLAAEHLLAGFGPNAPTIQVPWLALLATIPVGLVSLLTTSAVMVALASFADTFKQGQALLNSVMMVFILPAMFAVMPGVELSPGLALVPVVQTVLGIKALIAPNGLSAHGFDFTLVLVSQVLYAALALRLALHLTTREALALKGAKTSAIKTLLRPHGTPR